MESQNRKVVSLAMTALTAWAVLPLGARAAGVVVKTGASLSAAASEFSQAAAMSLRHMPSVSQINAANLVLPALSPNMPDLSLPVSPAMPIASGGGGATAAEPVLRGGGASITGTAPSGVAEPTLHGSGYAGGVINRRDAGTGDRAPGAEGTEMDGPSTIDLGGEKPGSAETAANQVAATSFKLGAPGTGISEARAMAGDAFDNTQGGTPGGDSVDVKVQAEIALGEKLSRFLQEADAAGAREQARIEGVKEVWRLREEKFQRLTDQAVEDRMEWFRIFRPEKSAAEMLSIEQAMRAQYLESYQQENRRWIADGLLPARPIE